MYYGISDDSELDQFAVVCLVTWRLNESEAGVGHYFFHVNSY